MSKLVLLMHTSLDGPVAGLSHKIILIKTVIQWKK